MALTGTVQSAMVGALGFDSNTVITSAIAQQFVAKGFKFCLRYVSRGSEPPKDLSTAEAERILNAGLALMPVQHAHPAGWTPSSTLGIQDGQHAASNASGVGFPAGVSVWCDLEGIASGTAAQIVIDYCNAWFDAVKASGYVPGLYVGSQCILDERQLFQLKFQHYWRSLSNVPNISKRGYQMIQLFPADVPINGLKVDIDVAQDDYKGGRAQWLVHATNQVRHNLAASTRTKGRGMPLRKSTPQDGPKRSTMT